MILEVIHGSVALHVGAEVAAHLKEDNASSVDVDFVLLLLDEVLRPAVFDVICIFTQFPLLRALIHRRARK